MTERKTENSVLIEDAKFEKVHESNSKTDDVISVYTGPIQKKSENKNGRVYTEEFWENFFNSESNQKRLENGLCLGQLGHPSKDQGVGVNLEKVTHFVSDVWESDEDSNIIEGKIHVLGEPTLGARLDTYLSAGIGLGVSSRAAVDHYSEGSREIIVDGEVYGWDFVEDASVAETHDIEQTEATEGHEIDPSELKDVNDLRHAINTESKSKKVSVMMEAVESKSKSDNDSIFEEDTSMGQSELSVEDVDRFDVDEVIENHSELRSHVNSIIDERDELEDQVDSQKEEIKRLRDRADALESDSNSISQKAINKLNDVKNEAQAMKNELEADLSDLRQRSKNKLESVKNEYQSFKEQAVQKLESVQQKFQEFEETFQSKLESVKEAHQQKMKKVEQKLKDIRRAHQESSGQSTEKLEAVREEHQNQKQSFKNKLEEVRDEAREMIKDTEEQYSEAVVSLYIDNTLHEMNASENESIRSAMEKASTVEEVDAIREKIERNQIAEEDNLPVPVQKEVDEVVGGDEKEEEVNETRERLRGIGEKMTGNSFRGNK